MARNEGLLFLDISKNNHISDEGSLVTLVQSLVANDTLRTIDLSGINIRKPFFQNHFNKALQKNITL